MRLDDYLTTTTYKGVNVADFTQGARSGFGSAKTLDPHLQQERAAALKAVAMPLDDLSRELDLARKRTYELSQGVARIADHLLGAEPENENTGGADQPPRQGTAWQLNDQARYIHNCLNELERQIGRLGPLVAG